MTAPGSAVTPPPQGRGRARSIGHYILGKTIGEGTFGKVKLGTHILTGEKVAVKVLEKDRIVDVADVERVAREVYILKLIRHSHVVQLYEIIETSRQLYLIMEYASGGELFDYIVASGRVEEREASHFFRQIVDGVEEIHKMNVVHRDLKPENLLLDEHRHIKVVDFGLSNTYRDGQLLKTACGSPCYAAPEMIAGKPYIPSFCDIWSCGVILFAMLCGYLPFEDQNTAALYQKILAGEYGLPDFLSASARDLIAGILTTNPQRRLDFPRIRLHSWFSLKPPDHVAEKIATVSQHVYLEEDILDELEKFGFPRDYTARCLRMNKHNHVSTTYHLLARKKQRMMDHVRLAQAEGVRTFRDEVRSYVPAGPNFDGMLSGDMEPTTSARMASVPAAGQPGYDVGAVDLGTPEPVAIRGASIPAAPASASPVPSGRVSAWTPRQQVSPPRVATPKSSRAATPTQSCTPRVATPDSNLASAELQQWHRPNSVNVSSVSPPRWVAPPRPRGDVRQAASTPPVGAPEVGPGHEHQAIASRRPPREQLRTPRSGGPPQPTDRAVAKSERGCGSAGVPVHQVDHGRTTHGPPGAQAGGGALLSPPRYTSKAVHGSPVAMQPTTPSAAGVLRTATAHVRSETPTRLSSLSTRVVQQATLQPSQAADTPPGSVPQVHQPQVPQLNLGAVSQVSSASSAPRSATTRARRQYEPHDSLSPRGVGHSIGSARPRLGAAVTSSVGAPGPPWSSRLGERPHSARVPTPEARVELAPGGALTMREGQKAERAAAGEILRTSTRPPRVILQELQRALAVQRIASRQISSCALRCQRLSVRFDLEVTPLDRLGSIHALRARRLAGEIWQYKDTCARLMTELRIT